ncbi:hypothetical protein EJB05_41821, partial [Eragrostis curvula]
MEVDGSSVSLPEEIIFDVLSWLPVKSLIRFRCVSKGWRLLISDPAFIATHKSRAAPLLVGSFVVPHDPTNTRNLGEAPELRVMDMDGNVLRVFKDVAGTVLSPSRLDLVCVDEGRQGAHVIDPTTGQVLTVGRYVDDPMADFLDVLGGPPFYRFGRATPSGEYKVVRLLGTHMWLDLIGHVCEVVTLGGSTGLSWRTRQNSPIRFCLCDGCTVAINGVIYFMPYGAHAQQGLWNRVGRFDLESEVWKAMIDGPPELRRPKPGQRLLAIGELKSTLTMVETIQSPYTSAYIWLLVDSERSMWVKGYTVQSVNMLYRVKPLEVLRDGRLLLLKTFETNGVSLQLYDFNTGTCTNLMDMPMEFKGGITLYTGNLLSSDRGYLLLRIKGRCSAISLRRKKQFTAA